MCSLFAAELPKTPVGRRGTKFPDSKMITHCITPWAGKKRPIVSGIAKQGWHKGFNVGFMPLVACSLLEEVVGFH